KLRQGSFYNRTLGIHHEWARGFGKPMAWFVGGWNPTMGVQARHEQAGLLEASFGEVNFGAAVLGDQRRTKRLVRVADAMVRHPGGSLPAKLRSPAELEALYHLMNCETVTHETVLAPHRALTLRKIAEH